MSASYLESIDSQLSQWVNPTDANNNAIASINNSTPAITNPDGNAVTVPTQPLATNQVVENNVQTWITTPLTNEVKPLANTTDTNNADIASTNVIGAEGNIINTAVSQVESQRDLTQKLSEIDTAQANTKIANANANLAELGVNERAQQIQKTANEEEYQNNLRLNQGEEIAALKVQQASELVKNDAEAAELKSKADKAERDATIANEVAQMQSNVAFAKLGGSFSWAAINTAQKLFTDGAYNIANLKSSNAYNYANLKVKINSVAFEHTQEIGKLIQATAEKEFASKERLRSFIWDSQNNILLGRKESQKAIQDAITTYKNEQQTRADKLFSTMNSANDRLATATENIQKSVNVEQTSAKSRIDAMVSNWLWSTMSSAQQIDLENKAWIPVGSTAKATIAKTTEIINDSVKALAWKSVQIPTNILAMMQTEIKRSMDLWVPLNVATQNALTKYSNRIPWLVSAQKAAVEKAKLDAQTEAAKIAKLNSETKENLAQANKATAEAAKVGKSGSWGGGGTGTTKSVDLQSKDIEYDIPHNVTIAWKTINLWNETVTAKWSYNKKTWEYSADWTVVKWARPTSKQSALDALFNQ